jgi:hypothetical protein
VRRSRISPSSVVFDSCHVSRLVAITRSAIMSIACASGISSHVVAYGRRYLTLYSRFGAVM